MAGIWTGSGWAVPLLRDIRDSVQRTGEEGNRRPNPITDEECDRARKASLLIGQAIALIQGVGDGWDQEVLIAAHEPRGIDPDSCLD